MANKLKKDIYYEKLKKILPGGVHYNFQLPWEEKPIPFKRGIGSRVWDLDNNEYLDFYAKFGSMILGHSNSKYNRALKNTIDKILAVNHCDIDVEVCELLVKHIPCAEMVRFGLSGTEIIQNAIRLARAYNGKNRFVRFLGHYHGNADNIMGGKIKNIEYPVPVDYKGDFKGTAGRADNILEDQSFLLPWNDIEVLKETLEKYQSEISAVIMEPVCINGGGIIPEPGYLEEVRNLCNRYNILLIFDEVITGFRMGLSGAQGYYDVIPDLAIYGKAVAGGGLPISVLAGRKEIMNLFSEKKVIHAGTFNGYPLGLTAIKATITILENKKLYDEMEENTEVIHKTMLDEANKLNIPMVIQGPIPCASYHCIDRELKSTEEYNGNIMLKDAIINTELAKAGILTSSISRIYSNISLNQEDVLFFKERIVKGLLGAKRILDEIY